MRVLLPAAWLLIVGASLEAQSGGEAVVLSRGAALEERGDLAQAESVYLEGLRAFPRSGEIAVRVGTLNLSLRHWPQAIEYLQKGHALRPRDVDALYYLAQAYYLDGQIGPARKAILDAATLAPARADIAQKQGEYLCEDNACAEGLRLLLKARGLDPTL